MSMELRTLSGEGVRRAASALAAFILARFESSSMSVGCAPADAVADILIAAASAREDLSILILPCLWR